MATLKELIDIVDWKDLKESFAKKVLEDENLDNFLEAYRLALEKLKLMEPCSSNMRIVFKIIDDADDEDYEKIEVYGKNGDLNKDQTGLDYKYHYQYLPPNEEVAYALDFISWNECLGMEIDKETLIKYDYDVIVVECIWEITFYSLSGNFEKFK